MDENDVVQFPINELEKLVGNFVMVYDGVFSLTGTLTKSEFLDGGIFTVSNASYDAYASFLLRQVTEIWRIDPSLPWKISLI